MIEVFKIIKHKYYKVAPELIYNVNIVTRGNDCRLSKIEVIMILGNFRSLIELLIGPYLEQFANAVYIVDIESVDLF